MQTILFPYQQKENNNNKRSIQLKIKPRSNEKGHSVFRQIESTKQGNIYVYIFFSNISALTNIH